MLLEEGVEEWNRRDRQVVGFTHDVSFVADLKREAKGLGVSLGERSVARGRRGERKPGTSSPNHA
jgi:hypothetical protein